MNFSEYKSAYDREGFVVIRGFLDAPQLNVLKENLDRYIRDVVPGLTSADAFFEDRARPESLRQMHRLEQDPFFAAYQQHPLWRQAAETLLGEPARVPTGVEWFNKPPGFRHVTPPHQDNFYFCLAPPQVLTMWLALDTVDEENGCLRYVPGSQQWGIRPHQRTATLGFSQGLTSFGQEELHLEVAVEAEPGDVLIHHGNTIHRAEANRSSTRHRRSFAMVFQGESCRRDESAFERYRAASETQQRELNTQAVSSCNSEEHS